MKTIENSPTRLHIRMWPRGPAIFVMAVGLFMANGGRGEIANGGGSGWVLVVLGALVVFGGLCVWLYRKDIICDATHGMFTLVARSILGNRRYEVPLDRIEQAVLLRNIGGKGTKPVLRLKDDTEFAINAAYSTGGYSPQLIHALNRWLSAQGQEAGAERG